MQAKRFRCGRGWQKFRTQRLKTVIQSTFLKLSIENFFNNHVNVSVTNFECLENVFNIFNYWTQPLKKLLFQLLYFPLTSRRVPISAEGRGAWDWFWYKTFVNDLLKYFWMMIKKLKMRIQKHIYFTKTA